MPLRSDTASWPPLTEFCHNTHWTHHNCRNPLDEWSTRHRDLYPKTHNIRKRQTSMSPAGFKPLLPASKRQQTLVLDRAASKSIISYLLFILYYFHSLIEKYGAWLKRWLLVGRSRDRSRWCHWIFQWHIPSDCTLDLGWTQPLVKMSTTNIFWG